MTQPVRRSWIRDVLAVLLLAGLCLLFFWAIITPNLADRGSFPPGDFGDQFHAFAVFESHELAAGRVPLWCPYFYGGHPFQADIQAAVFYPLSLVTIALNWLISGPAVTFLALEWEAIAHFWLASVFTYFFARRLMRHRGAALVSAITFAYGGYLTSYPSQQLAILEVGIWLPLILWCMDIGLERLGGYPSAPLIGRGNSGSGLPLAGLFWGVSLLAGHPQTSMYVFYTALLYFIFAAWRYRVRWQRALLAFVFMQAIGFGLAAVHLIPGIEYMRLSVRAQISYDEVAGGFARQDITQLLLPGSAGVMSPLYVGILPLLLAVLTAVLWFFEPVRHRAQTIFWWGVAAVALLLSFGGNTFFYSLFYLAVPGFGLFRSQERVAFIFSFALALLAGFGTLCLLHALNKPRKRLFNRFAAAVGYLTVGSLLLVALSYYGWLTEGWAADSIFGAGLTRSVLLSLLLALSGFLFWLRKQRRIRTILWLSFVVALIVFDLFTANWKNNLVDRQPEDYWPSSPLVLVPMQDPDKPFRLHNEWRLPGNYGCVYGLEDIWGASPLRIRWYDEFLRKVPLERAWQMLNVKYVITWRKTLAPPSERLYEESQNSLRHTEHRGPSQAAPPTEMAYLHRLDRVGPRAWMVYKARALGDAESLALLANTSFDPFAEAVLSEALPFPLEQEASVGQPPGIVWRSSSPTGLSLDVYTPQDGLLVLSEVYYPGWQATVDGAPAHIYRAQYALRAIPLRAGEHHVELAFRPATFTAGAAVSAAALLAVLILVAWSVPPEKRLLGGCP